VLEKPFGRDLRQEPGIRENSSIETYAALEFYLDNWRWAGIPFFVRTGKRLARHMTEISVHFKRTPRGDATLFTRGDEVEAERRIITPIEEAWAQLPPTSFPNYAAGATRRRTSSQLVEIIDLSAIPVDESRGSTRSHATRCREAGGDFHVCAGVGVRGVEVRDQWIGWDDATRVRHLPQVVNNSRVLLSPWVHIKNLASATLARVLRRLPADGSQGSVST
jgi:hypothetical protein